MDLFMTFIPTSAAAFTCKGVNDLEKSETIEKNLLPTKIGWPARVQESRECYNPRPKVRETRSEVQMRTSASDEVTQLLLAWNAGDDQALAQLTPLVYNELHRLAHRYMAGERTGHSLQTSALVNE